MAFGNVFPVPRLMFLIKESVLSYEENNKTTLDSFKFKKVLNIVKTNLLTIIFDDFSTCL